MRRVYTSGLFLMITLFVAAADAHMIWVKCDESGGQARKAVLYFSGTSELLGERMPERIATAHVMTRLSDEKTDQLEMQEQEGEDGTVWLQAPLPNANVLGVEATCQYGLYHGFLLLYSAKHVCRTGNQTEQNDAALDLYASSDFALDLTGSVADGEADLVVLWQGKPLSGAEATIFGPKGRPQRAKSDAKGQIKFPLTQRGLYGVIVNHVEEDVTGEVNGESYRDVNYYSTLTFESVTERADQKAAEAARRAASRPKLSQDDALGSEQSEDGQSRSDLEKQGAIGRMILPEAVASFGGAVLNGYLYVYGGHCGETHAHSRDNLWQHFVRLHLEDGQGEELPMETPLQGFPLVTDGHYLYRIGGLTARNAADEAEDLHSVDEFARFDPVAGEWTRLAPLPAGRSSHDAVVLGNKLYVAGGWNISGQPDGDWHTEVLEFDLGQPERGWKTVPVKVERRAIAMAPWRGKLVVIGGMTPDHEVSEKVEIIDVNTGESTRGPDFPGETMHGFGVSAWTLGERVFASGNSGAVLRLSDDGKSWEEVARLKTPRFFHRLLPHGQNMLMAVGGASHTIGHLDDIETVVIEGD